MIEAIPRVFHTFWDGPPRPDYVERAIDSWLPLHPGWKLVVWTEDTLPDLRNRDLIDRQPEVSPKSNRYQFMTNLLRLEVLYDQGGVWIDADLEALRSVEPLMAGTEAFTSRESREYVNNGFTGCVPGHAWYGEMLKRVRGRVLNHPGWRSNKQCGPHLYTETIRRHPGVRILPASLIYPVGYRDADGPPPSAEELRERFPEAYTSHHWNNKLNLRGLTKGNR